MERYEPDRDEDCRVDEVLLYGNLNQEVPAGFPPGKEPVKGVREENNPDKHRPLKSPVIGSPVARRTHAKSPQKIMASPMILNTSFER